MIRGVEVEQRLKGKVDKSVILVCRALAEDNSMLRKENLALAQVVDQLINHVTQQGAVQGAMAEHIHKLRGGNVDSEAVE